jgi:hypothetical protein
MNKQDIYKYLLFEDEIKDIKLKKQIDNNVTKELEKLTPAILSNECTRLNVDYNILKGSNTRKLKLQSIGNELFAKIILLAIPATCMIAIPILSTLMNYFKIGKPHDENLLLDFILFVIGLICTYFIFKNFKLIKIIEDNLKKIND